MATTFSTKDLVAGGVFVVAGAYFALESLNYKLGTAFRMGPGYIPLLLGSALAVLGVAIAASGWKKPEGDKLLPVPWRGLALVVATIAFFGATVRGLGFVPVVFISAFATALASRLNSPLFAALLAVALSVLCTLIFKVGLGLGVPLFGPWLGQ